jgi:uncharacterized membrane protein YkvA (DUF1232 family)
VNSLAARLARVVALLKDPRTPKLLVLAAALYMLWPLDLVPDFMVPVAGFLDDAMVWWFALRSLFKAGEAATGKPSGG